MKQCPCDNAIIPKVEVLIRIKRVLGLDFGTQTFECDVLLMLDWEDPSIKLLGDNDVYDADHHFHPQIEFDNHVADDFNYVGGGKAEPRIKDKKTCWVTITNRVVGEDLYRHVAVLAPYSHLRSPRFAVVSKAPRSRLLRHGHQRKIREPFSNIAEPKALIDKIREYIPFKSLRAIQLQPD